MMWVLEMPARMTWWCPPVWQCHQQQHQFNRHCAVAIQDQQRHITITGYIGTGGALTIPSTINGYPVTSIGDSVFYYCTNLTSVTIPSSVTSIGSQAFAFCHNLSGIYFQGNAPSADSTVFSSDNNATVYYLPGTTGWSDFSANTGLRSRYGSFRTREF